jgi:FixJ family two-component response regulator
LSLATRVEPWRVTLIRPAKQIVIVVDDDVEVRDSLESLLKSADFGAALFSSAEEVLASTLLAEASCLITDVRMPGMHGPELQRHIKREYPELPIILITGHRDEQIRQSVLSEGAITLLYKPFDPSDLLRAIHEAIEDPTKAI